MNERKVLLFIPAYNCEKQIVRVLQQIDDNVLSIIDQVIVVNNRSTDSTEEETIQYLRCHKQLPVRVLRNRDNYGLGGSHKIAFQYARQYGFDYVIVLHGDDQGTIRDLIPYLKSDLAWNYDSLLGSRFEPKSKLINYSKFRIFGNNIFNCFMTILLRKRITDLGSGLNMYKVSYLKSGFYKYFPNNLTFNVYMLIYGIYSKSKFAFFPLSWREEDQISNAKMLKQSAEIVKLTVSYVHNPSCVFNRNENKYSALSYEWDMVYPEEDESDVK